MPRDCTAHPLSLGLLADEQSPDHRVSHTMKQKQKQNNKQAKTLTRDQAYAKRQKNGVIGPMQMLGGAVGGIAGMSFGPLGAAAGAGLGAAIGNGIGYFTGSGDYKVSMNACTVPGYKNSDSTVITHREYITDVLSGPTLAGASTAFDIQKFALQPGDASTFPWLANIAANYEEYDIHGMVFAFVATSGESVASTNTALGTVILATEYDPTKPDFVNKQAMENYHFATSAKPSVNQLHAVECAKVRTPVKQLYIRSGASTGSDIRWSDFGNFYIATVGCPAASTTLGELWVTYKIKLIKPRLPITVGFGGQIATGWITRTGVNSLANSFGTVTLSSGGPLVIAPILNNQTFRFRALPNMDYMVMTYHYGTALGVVNNPSILSGAVYQNAFKSKIVPEAFANSATDCVHLNRLTCTNTDTDGYVTLSLNITGTPNASVDVYVTQLDEVF